MTYPNQLSVRDRLQTETTKAHDDLAKAYLQDLAKLWHNTNLTLRGAIYAEYRNHFAERWNLVDAKKMGTLIRIERRISQILQEFKDGSKTYVDWALRDLYHHSVARHAWILDQITPPIFKVKIPNKRGMHEAAPDWQPPKPPPVAWGQRWDTWIDAYNAALNHNIKLGAMNGSTAEEATAEVDQTMPGSPRYTLWDSFQRIFAFEAQGAFVGGQNNVAQANGDMVEEEIWQTRYNDRVCEICDDMAGKTVDEVADEGESIPAHPNCRCFWETVPKKWADLLRSGNADDRDLAIDMEARGLVPYSMTVLDANGNPAASLIVSFQEWIKGAPMAVSGR